MDASYTLHTQVKAFIYVNTILFLAGGFGESFPDNSPLLIRDVCCNIGWLKKVY